MKKAVEETEPYSAAEQFQIAARAEEVHRDIIDRLNRGSRDDLDWSVNVAALLASLSSVLKYQPPGVRISTARSVCDAIMRSMWESLG